MDFLQSLVSAQLFEPCILRSTPTTFKSFELSTVTIKRCHSNLALYNIYHPPQSTYTAILYTVNSATTATTSSRPSASTVHYVTIYAPLYLPANNASSATTIGLYCPQIAYCHYYTVTVATFSYCGNYTPQQ